MLLRLLPFVLLLAAGAATAASPANQYGYTGSAWVPVLVNADGSIVITTSPSSAAIALGQSSAAEGSHVLKGAAGDLVSLNITNGATAGYVLVYNRTTAPGDGAVTPAACYAMPATTSSLSVSFGPFPASFSTGITVVYSSTGCFTQTTSTTAMFSWQVQ